MKTPLIFQPVYKSEVWGGGAVAAKYRREGTPSVCSESIELSGCTGTTNVVSVGKFAGRTLADMVAEYGASLVGTKAPDASKFPLVFKIVDATDRLSVHVHPSATSIAVTGGEVKNEVLYVLGSKPGSCLYLGLEFSADETIMRKALAVNRVGAILHRAQVAPGEAFYLPGGLLHSIGAGCLVYEISQAADTSFRLFDWNREPKRPLQTEDALKTISWDIPVPKPRKAGCCTVSDATVVTCRSFCLTRLLLREPRSVAMDGTSFHVLFVEKGSATVTCGGETITFCAGASCLVPADAESYALSPVEQNTVVLRTTL